MAKNETNTKSDLLAEAGPAEGSLTPGGGTGSGDIKTKTIADIVAKLGSLGPDDLNGFKATIDQIGKEADVMAGGEMGKNMKSIETKPSHASTKGLVKEDLAKIFGQEGDVLSESFIENATTLFESAVTLRVADEVEQVELALREEADSALAELQETYNTRMDSYLDYVAEQFVESHRPAFEAQAKAELNEAFIQDIRSVFESHDLNLPEADFDTVSELQAQLADLTESLNESLAVSIGLAEEVENMSKASVLNNVMEGLTDSQKDKMVTLSEDIDFEDEDQFRSKVGAIKESFFTEASSGSNGLILEEDGLPIEEEKKAPEGRMGAYVQAISRNVNK